MSYLSDKEIDDILSKHGMVLLSDLREMETEVIIKALGCMDIQLDRKRFGELSETVPSVEEMLEDIMEEDGLEIENWTTVWNCLRVLWERWLPGKINLETINDRMQDGYDKLEMSGVIAACEIWLEVWEDIMFLIEKYEMETIEDYDSRFSGLQSFHNWFQDFETELGNAGGQDGKYHSDRISVCERFLKVLTSEDSLLVENTRRGLAESWFAIGEVQKGEKLLRRWLGEDPTWGWGWIDWSDYYRYGCFGNEDYEKAEEILKKALEIPGIRDKEYILERLRDM